MSGIEEAVSSIEDIHGPLSLSFIRRPDHKISYSVRVEIPLRVESVSKHPPTLYQVPNQFVLQLHLKVREGEYPLVLLGVTVEYEDFANIVNYISL